MTRNESEKHRKTGRKRKEDTKMETCERMSKYGD